ncbi:MAG: hypothetical protein GX974_10395, partial [Clostridiales bacterium]|nr:hypothetical protein [Clostridiales bacterium]
MKKYNKAMSITMLLIWDIAVSILATSMAATIISGKGQFELFHSYMILFVMLLLGFSILFRCYNNIWRYAG